MENVKFVKRLRKLVGESYCQNGCDACVLHKTIIDDRDDGGDQYDICDVLDLIENELDKLDN